MKPDFLRRLERLLVLIPFVAKHKAGAPLAEVLAFGGYRDAAELDADLSLATEIGLPPEGPTDFLEITIQGDRVEVVLPQRFHRPPRLTVMEGAALSAALRALGEAAGTALGSALERLRHALPEGVEGSLAKTERRIEIEAPPQSGWHPVLQDAIDRRREVTLTYWARSREATERPAIEPLLLHVHRGHWYLVAWNPAVRAERTYRLDRVLGVQVSERTFEPRPAPDLSTYDDQLYQARPAEAQAEVRLSAELESYVRERWGERARRNADGSFTVTTPVLGGEPHFLSWVLGFGGQTEIVSPPELRAAFAERVRRLRELYGDK